MAGRPRKTPIIKETFVKQLTVADVEEQKKQLEETNPVEPVHDFEKIRQDAARELYLKEKFEARRAAGLSGPPIEHKAQSFGG